MRASYQMQCPLLNMLCGPFLKARGCYKFMHVSLGKYKPIKVMMCNALQGMPGEGEVSKGFCQFMHVLLQDLREEETGVA